MPEERIGVLLALAHSTGGIGRHVKALAEGLPSRGVDITVCGPAETLAALGFEPLEPSVVAAPLGHVAPGALVHCRRTLRQLATRVDITHAHGLRAGADCAAFAGGTPLIVTWHNAALGRGASRRRHAVLARYVARSADLTLAASEDLAAAATAAGAKLVQDGFVAAPAMAPAQRSSAQTRAALGVGDRPLVLAVGRLQRQKRFDVLVEAAALWRGDESAPIVVIAGEGPEGGSLSAQIEATGAPVQLLGAREDVADLLAAADVVALPSEWEARSLVAQEALRAGVPLVTTAVGGLPAVVGDAAVLVAVGDAAGLRTAIESVVHDDARRRRLISLGLERAATWPTEQQRLDDLAQTYFDLNRRVRPQGS